MNGRPEEPEMTMPSVPLVFGASGGIWTHDPKLQGRFAVP